MVWVGQSDWKWQTTQRFQESGNGCEVSWNPEQIPLSPRRYFHVQAQAAVGEFPWASASCWAVSGVQCHFGSCIAAVSLPRAAVHVSWLRSGITRVPQGHGDITDSKGSCHWFLGRLGFYCLYRCQMICWLLEALKCLLLKNDLSWEKEKPVACSEGTVSCSWVWVEMGNARK